MACGHLSSSISSLKRSLELLQGCARSDRELLSLASLYEREALEFQSFRQLLASSVLILAGCGGSSSPSTSGGTGGSKQQVIVNIVSKPSQVLAGTNFQFKATVVGISGDQAVNWAVPTPNGGSIDTTGLYVAPTSGAFPMSVTVTATSQADPADATSTSFTVTQDGQPGVVTYHRQSGPAWGRSQLAVQRHGSRHLRQSRCELDGSNAKWWNDRFHRSLYRTHFRDISAECVGHGDIPGGSEPLPRHRALPSRRRIRWAPLQGRQ